MKRLLLLSLFACILLHEAHAQARIQSDGQFGDTRGEANHFRTDSIEKEGVPEGIYAWTVERRFGTIRPVSYDTIPHLFPQEALTDGPTGHYNFLGNLGAPRISRLMSEQGANTFEGQFLFSQPYSYFLRKPEEILFTNTKSPFTNLTYHECGNKQHGEDRLRALFSVNAGKRAGFGFKIDYLYGRGYYDSQATSQFGSTLFGSYLGERYVLHASYQANHLKTTENGGIESDTYVTNPESLPTRYGPADMPINLGKTWNKLNVNSLFLNHKYHLGYTRYRDAEGNIVKVRHDRLPAALQTQLPDSLPADSALQAPADTLVLRPEFVPLTSIVHTLRLDHNNRRFLSNASNTVASAYFLNAYLPGDSANDFTKYLHLENTVALEFHEGANKWLRSGGHLYFRHELYKFTLPDLSDAGERYVHSYTDNYITLGAAMQKDGGRYFRYHLLGEIRSNGKAWGEFNVEARAAANIPFRKDTLHVSADGFLRREEPGFYLRHYHARNAWWDNSLDQQIRLRAGATLAYRDTRLSLILESQQNPAYLQETQASYLGTDDDIQRARFGVEVRQKSGNVQLIQASLAHNHRWGILHWENELTLQTTTDKEVLPLPLLNVWSNLYIKFNIARVLHTELGADLRYFTRYYAPAYSPLVGAYATQDADARVKVGNYPVVNAYANFHLKRTRFYVMATHVNSSSGGHPFLVPHHPLNRLVLRLGLSWNFIN